MSVDRRSAPLTYADVGVDIERADRFVERIAEQAAMTRRPEVLADIGPFAGLFRLPTYKKPVLVASTDGVGTKVKLAALLGKYRSVGMDLVNHCVNDLLTRGAEPLFFLDYIGAAGLDDEARIQIIEGIVSACRECGCSLLGGETADMPGLYREGDFDLVGTIIGVVEEEEIIDGSRILVGDVLLGLPSSGLHTNGYSLVRRVFGVGMNVDPVDERNRLDRTYPSLGLTLGEELLKPHRCYYSELRPVLDRLKGICHITGSGITGGSISANIDRVLAPDLRADIDKSSWPGQPIFKLIQERGNVSEEEMYRTFNMGLGMVLVVDQGDAEQLRGEIPEALTIGRIVPRSEGDQAVVLK